MTKDPSMLGGTNYPRAELDHYPTPEKVTKALLSVIEDDLAGMSFWEPCVGRGDIYNVIEPHTRAAGSSDIIRYAGFEPTGLFDFFNIYPDGDKHEQAVAKWMKTDMSSQRPQSMKDVEALFGFRPDLIITNPPYGKMAEKTVRKALELMEDEKGDVIFLMRHEWDTAKTRADLFDHPAFTAKVTLRFRPIWVEKKEGEKSSSPRFSYAWYWWSFSKAALVPHARPEMFYAS